MLTKKRLNSKRKGNSAELELSKLLTEHFDLTFSRVGVASGARVKNTKLPEHAIGVMTGDLIVPSGFRFCVECKAVNTEIDLLAPSAQFDRWLLQVTDDASSIGRLPMLCWKRHRRGWIAAVPSIMFGHEGNLPVYHTLYREWLVCQLDALLEVDDPKFWFIDETER